MRSAPILVGLSALALLASQCKDNFDVQIPGSGALICIKIGAKRAPTQADLQAQIREVNPPPTSYERVPSEDHDGFYIWILKVEFPGLARGSAPRKVHIGIDLNEGAEWERVSTVIANAPQPTPPNLQVTGTGQQPLLSVENPSPDVALRLDTLQVAVDPVNVPLANLNYNDPLVAGLPWIQVINSSMVLAPGEIRTFPLPPSLANAPGHRFVRGLYNDQAGSLTAGPLGIVQQGLPPLVAIPTLETYGVAGLFLAMVLAAVVILRSRRRVT